MVFVLVSLLTFFFIYIFTPSPCHGGHVYSPHTPVYSPESVECLPINLKDRSYKMRAIAGDKVAMRLLNRGAEDTVSAISRWKASHATLEEQTKWDAALNRIQVVARRSVASMLWGVREGFVRARMRKGRIYLDRSKKE